MNRSIASSIWIIGYSSGIFVTVSYQLIGLASTIPLAVLLGVVGARVVGKLLPDRGME